MPIKSKDGSTDSDNVKDVMESPKLSGFDGFHSGDLRSPEVDKFNSLPTENMDEFMKRVSNSGIAGTSRKN